MDYLLYLKPDLEVQLNTWINKGRHKPKEWAERQSSNRNQDSPMKPVSMKEIGVLCSDHTQSLNSERAGNPKMDQGHD